MPLPLTKTSDEWSDVNKALGGYKKLMEQLRTNADTEISTLLDEIDTRVEGGEELEPLLEEFGSKSTIFKQWVDTVNKKESRVHSPGEELVGLDHQGRRVAGKYVRSVLGQPEINTGRDFIVLDELL